LRGGKGKSVAKALFRRGHIGNLVWGGRKEVISSVYWRKSETSGSVSAFYTGRGSCGGEDFTYIRKSEGESNGGTFWGSERNMRLRFSLRYDRRVV